MSAIEIDATTLDAQVTGAGVISLADTAGGLTANSVSTADGNITLSAASGNLTATLVTAGGSGNVQLTTTTTGNVLLGSVTAAGTAAVTSAGAIEESGADGGADITGPTVSLASVLGIGGSGRLEIDAGTLSSATASGTGAGIDLSDVTGGMVVTSATTSNGSLALDAQNGDLTATTVTAGGSVRTAQLTTDLVASVTGTGTLDVADTAGGLNVTSATAADGKLVLLAQNGNLSASSVAVSGTSRNAVLLMSGSGDVLLGDVSASDGAFTASSVGAIQELGADAGSDVTANVAVLDSQTGVGTSGQLEVAVNIITSLTAATSGGIDVADTAGGLSVSNASTINVDINLQATAGDLTLTNIIANGHGRDVSASSLTSGDVLVGNVVAAGDAVTMTAAGSILELNTDPAADITTVNLTMLAAGDIGGAETLEVKAATLDAESTGLGAINLEDLNGSLRVTARTSSGAITLVGNGNTTLANVVAVGNNPITASTLTTGNILVVNVFSGGDINISSVGNINETVVDAGADISTGTGTITLTSATGIGNSGTIELDARTLVASVTGNGRIDLRDMAGTMLGSTSTTNGAIAIHAQAGDLRANSITAGGGNGAVTLGTSAGSIRLDSVSATGSVLITANGNVSEVGADAGAEIMAGGNSQIQAIGGQISASAGTALEVQITNATLSVRADTAVSGVSVRIDGTVSPTNTLIKLNTPPGSMLFNGVPVP